MTYQTTQPVQYAVAALNPDVRPWDERDDAISDFAAAIAMAHRRLRKLEAQVAALEAENVALRAALNTSA